MHLRHLFERYQDRTVELDAWLGNPNIYVSFTALPKVGLNPRSSFDTPLGVYAYPLQEMYRDIVDDNIPHGGEHPYIQVLEANNVVELSQYGEADLTRDVAKLKAKFAQASPVLAAAKVELETYYRRHARDPAAGWDIAHEDRRTRDGRIAKLIQDMDASGGSFDFMVHSEWGFDSKPKTPAGKMWNITRNIAILLAQNKPVTAITAKPSAVAWNVILRGLGYQAFSDKRGTGLIHENEPVSAVFLSASAYQHRQTIHNIQKFVPAIRFTHLRDLTARLSDAAAVPKASQSEALKLRGYILAEWHRLLDGQSDHIEWIGWDFHATLAADFPAFMQALLQQQFNLQLPLIAKELRRRDFFNSVEVVNAVLAISPTKRQLPLYVQVMLDQGTGNDAAYVLERTGFGVTEAANHVGRAILRHVLAASGSPVALLPRLLGAQSWWRLNRLLARDVSDEPDA
jgi:hypothetical protein